MFVDPQYRTCFISSFWGPDFEVAPRFFWKICGFLCKTTVPIADPEIILQQKFLNYQWLPVDSIVRPLHKYNAVHKHSHNKLGYLYSTGYTKWCNTYRK
jgi:hypothetical protein